MLPTLKIAKYVASIKYANSFDSAGSDMHMGSNGYICSCIRYVCIIRNESIVKWVVSYALFNRFLQ